MTIDILETKQSDINIIKQFEYKIKNEKINYKNKVCKKPWGYEYLCFETEKIGIWQLRIYINNKTSLHTHFKKDTILLVLDGKVKLNMIDDYKIYETLDLIFIPKKKFHGIEPISDYIDILEIEIFDNDTNFSNKNDLYRLIDGYVREKNYEKSIEPIYNNLHEYNYFFLDLTYKYIYLNKYNDTNLIINNKFINYNKINNYYILIYKEIFFNNKIFKEGSIFSHDEFFDKEFQNIIQKNENIFLTLENNYLEKNKIIHNNLELQYITQKYKKKNKKLILTSGCFDILHIGHIELLKKAKALGDILIVCLSKDEQIKVLKGDTRPINKNDDRLNLFITIKYVDYVYLYDENNLNENEEKLDEIMNIVDPHYWVKGNDYTIQEIQKKHPKLNNIKLIDLIENKSTTNIINKIKNS